MRKIRLLLEVVDGKKRCRALTRCWRENWRISQRKAAFIEKITSCFDDFSTHAENGRLARRAHPEMAMLHQEINAMLFEGNRIRIVVRHALDNLNAGNIKFVAAGGALISTDFAFNDDAGFLGEAFYRIEHFRRNSTFGNHSLDHATAIAEDWKEELPAFAEIVEPAADGDGLAFVLADFSDCSDRCHYLGDFHRREKQIPRFSRNDNFQINVRSRDQESRCRDFSSLCRQLSKGLSHLFYGIHLFVCFNLQQQ